MILREWASASIAANGTVIKMDEGFQQNSFTHPAVGVFNAKLVDSIGVDEAVFAITPLTRGVKIPKMTYAAALNADGVTVEINLFSAENNVNVGNPIDDAFSIIVSRFSPG